MKILDMPCTKGFMQIAQDGVDKGWHEMNGGNLSYRLTDAETKNVKAVCRKPASGPGAPASGSRTRLPRKKTMEAHKSPNTLRTHKKGRRITATAFRYFYTVFISERTS